MGGSVHDSADGVDRSAVLWARVRMAWAMLAGTSPHDAPPGREREEPTPPQGDEPAVEAEGFAEEALPWLDAVYRFSLRLTQGDRDAADDLTQESFLRAHRFWGTYQRGTNVKSWLFTICRNVFLHHHNKLRNRKERPEADLADPVLDLADRSALRSPGPDPAGVFFGSLIDDEVIRAIDSLPIDFREVFVLSDLGDLKYSEIAEVLGVPVGTAKSRLFRARRMLQIRLASYAAEAGFSQRSGR